MMLKIETYDKDIINNILEEARALVAKTYQFRSHIRVLNKAAILEEVSYLLTKGNFLFEVWNYITNSMISSYLVATESI